jgi:hypothetical protein
VEDVGKPTSASACSCRNYKPGEKAQHHLLGLDVRLKTEMVNKMGTYEFESLVSYRIAFLRIRIRTKEDLSLSFAVGVFAMPSYR